MSQNYLVDIVDVVRNLQGRGYDANSTPNLEENLKIYRSAAHKRICNYVGYEILSTAYTDELYFGNGTHYLDLINRPITAITTVKADDVEQTLSLFEIYHSRALYYKDGFFHRYNDWKISYTAGYTRTTMPGDIRLVSLELIALYASESGPKGSIGLSSFSQPEGSGSTFDPESEDRILSKLDSYRSMH